MENEKKIKVVLLEPGKLANFVLLDDELNIHAVYVKGKPAYSDFGPAVA